MSNIREILRDLREKGFNKFGKDDRTYFVYDNAADITEFYIKKGHKAQNEVKELFDAMQNPKFAKAVKKVVKTQDEYPLVLGFATVIAEFLEKRHQGLDEELLTIYGKAIDKILKSRVGELNEELGLDKDLIRELLIIVPEPEAISDPRFVGIYVQRILRKLYALSKENELGLAKVKDVKKLFKALFGRDMLDDVVVSILLERKDIIRNFNENQKAVWNLMTNYALKELEKKEDKDDVKVIIKKYIGRREKDAKNDRDSARRIQFAQVSEEDYPMLHEVAAKLSKKDEFAKFL
jgi:hypothetical protein